MPADCGGAERHARDRRRPHSGDGGAVRARARLARPNRRLSDRSDKTWEGVMGLRRVAGAGAAHGRVVRAGRAGAGSGAARAADAGGVQPDEHGRLRRLTGRRAPGGRGAAGGHQDHGGSGGSAAVLAQSAGRRAARRGADPPLHLVRRRT
ncbi:hypothetical protein Ddc_20038 [Ditylenchus destructor]|nr:hypothetical protein Ddc_20038 [Ditylenchus destructor]